LLAFKDLSAGEQEDLAILAAARAGFEEEFTCLGWDGHFPAVESKLREFANYRYNGPKSILITGPVGVGKTAFLCLMFKETFRTWANFIPAEFAEKLPIIFALETTCVTHMDIRTACLNLSRRENEQQEGYDYNNLTKCNHLIIDDLFTAPETPYVISMMEELIRQRAANKRMTWITTNISEADMKNEKKFPGWERVVSRLSNRNWMALVELKGQDRRK